MAEESDSSDDSDGLDSEFFEARVVSEPYLLSDVAFYRRTHSIPNIAASMIGTLGSRWVLCLTSPRVSG